MRPLGSIQKEMIECLKDHGSWFKGCGWLWDTPSNTKRILDSLVKRGKVITTTKWYGSRTITVYKLNPLTESEEHFGEDNDHKEGNKESNKESNEANR